MQLAVLTRSSSPSDNLECSKKAWDCRETAPVQVVPPHTVYCKLFMPLICPAVRRLLLLLLLLLSFLLPLLLLLQRPSMWTLSTPGGVRS